MRVRPIFQVSPSIAKNQDQSNSIHAKSLLTWAVAGLSRLKSQEPRLRCRVRKCAGTAFRCHVVPALALLFAFVPLFAPPAQAQTDPIWFTTMTIDTPPEYVGADWRGYGDGDSATLDDPNDSVGSLEEDEFSYSGTDNRVKSVSAGTGGVQIILESSLTEWGNLVLEFAGEEFPFEGAFVYGNGTQFVWDEFNSSWVSNNAPSLGPDRYATTLPLGGTTGVCLRTLDQTCPTTGSPSATQVVPEIVFVPLTARFTDVPIEHDGTTPFSQQIAFSEPVEMTEEQMQQALIVTGGTVTRAQQVDGRSKLWEVTVTPNSNGDVRISLPPTTSCIAVGAVCSSNDRKVLQRGVAVSIARAPLSARFEHVPAGHYRTASFALQLAFSEPIEMPEEKIQRTLMVTGGRMKSVQQVNGSSDLWELTAIPDSNDDVSLSLPPTTSCDADNAICTADGRMLSEGVAVSVARMPLTARFEEVPAEHIGTLPFTLRIAFSEPIGLTIPAMQRALTVTGDKTTSLLRVNGRSDLWEAKIQPNGDDVRISLSPTTSCNGEGAVCTPDGVALQNDAQAVIPFAGYATPHSLAKVSGDDQEGAASTQLAEPFVVLASDENGAAMAGARVAFTVTSGGGMLSAIADANPCIFKSAKASITAITDANGQATTRLTLGSQPGTNTVAVSVEGLEPETFTATATEPAMPHSLSKVCGDDQEGTVGQRLAEPLVVLVSDENGAAIAGVAVAFAVTAGEGTLSTTTDTTAANGRALTYLTLGSELGTNTVEVSVEGLEPVTFTAAGQESPLASLFDAFQNGRGKLVALPDSPQLAQNAPNPFNSQTVLAYFLPAAGPVRLEVFALIGQRVAVLYQGPQQAGYHRLRWDGRDDVGRSMASGMYLYRLMTDGTVLTRKLMLLR